jgi:hypothetical protein
MLNVWMKYKGPDRVSTRSRELQKHQYYTKMKFNIWDLMSQAIPFPALDVPVRFPLSFEERSQYHESSRVLPDYDVLFSVHFIIRQHN